MTRRTGRELKVKRAYEAPARSDGRRILVDRIWPRGIDKSDLRIEGWLKDLAPSTGLRRWFHHEPAKWAEFKRRYFRELDRQPDTLQRLRQLRRTGTVTLVFAAKDTDHNNAVALKEYLGRRGRKGGSP